jgi:hypothetical protein
MNVSMASGITAPGCSNRPGSGTCSAGAQSRAGSAAPPAADMTEVDVIEDMVLQQRRLVGGKPNNASRCRPVRTVRRTMTDSHGCGVAKTCGPSCRDQLGQRAALYCRVSTADQSCERQERDLTPLLSAPATRWWGSTRKPARARGWTAANAGKSSRLATKGLLIFHRWQRLVISMVEEENLLPDRRQAPRPEQKHRPRDHEAAPPC